MRVYLYIFLLFVLVVFAAAYAVVNSRKEQDITNNYPANNKADTGVINEENSSTIPLSSLTGRQQAIFWQSFNRMMEWGKEGEIKAFTDRVTDFTVTYHTGTRYLDANNRTCRHYALQVRRGADRINRRGIACRTDVEHWCQQRRGKREKCRSTGAGKLDNILNSTSIKQRNLSIKANRFFRDLGF